MTFALGFLVLARDLVYVGLLGNHAEKQLNPCGFCSVDLSLIVGTCTARHLHQAALREAIEAVEDTGGRRKTGKVEEWLDKTKSDS